MKFAFELMLFLSTWTIVVWFAYCVSKAYGRIADIHAWMKEQREQK